MFSCSVLMPLGIKAKKRQDQKFLLRHLNLLFSKSYADKIELEYRYKTCYNPYTRLKSLKENIFGAQSIPHDVSLFLKSIFDGEICFLL